VSDPTGVFL
jgi:amino acid transporter